MRFVAREFKWMEVRTDLFAPGASHVHSRLIDFCCLKGGLAEELFTFELDVVDAYYHAEELEEVYVGPPLLFVEQLRRKGEPTDVMWRLKKQLPGRHRAGQMWTEHLAGLLVDIGLEQCQEARQFFVQRSLWLGLGAHMEDMHGFGGKMAIAEFVKQLRSRLELKGGEPF